MAFMLLFFFLVYGWLANSSEIKQSDLSGQQPSADDEVCQSILEVTSSSTEPDCQPLGDCTGLSCYSTTSNKTVEIAVNKCTDPLVVNITVYDDTITGSSVYITEQVTGTGDIGTSGSVDSKYKVDVFERNRFTLAISVSYSFDNSILPAVPITRIPLNSSICMCQTLKYTVENSNSPLFGSCHVSDNCTGHQCKLFDSSLFLLTEFDPCISPAGITFTVTDSEASDVTLWRHLFSVESEEVLIMNTYLLNVTLKQMKYSLFIHVGMFDDQKNWYEVIPNTQVILDYTKCPHPPIDNRSPAPLQPTINHKSQGISPETCNALKIVRDKINENDMATCELNANCDTITCEANKQYLVEFRLSPCEDPPTFHMVLSNNEDILYEGTITETTSIPIMTMAKFTITLKHREDSVNVKLDIKLGFSNYPLLPDTTIPINKRYCLMDTIVDSVSPTSDHLNTPPTTTPEPPSLQTPPTTTPEPPSLQTPSQSTPLASPPSNDQSLRDKVEL